MQSITIEPIGEKLTIESIVYVVCRYFGIDAREISFDYLPEIAEEITPFFAELLDTIKKEASKILTALEDNYKRLCEERGVNPMAEYAPEEKTVEAKPSKIISLKEPPIEPPYKVASRIEKTAIGVDFTHYDILPVKSALKTTTEKQRETPPAPKPTPATQIYIPRNRFLPTH